MGKPGPGNTGSPGTRLWAQGMFLSSESSVGGEPGELKHLSTRRRRNQAEIPQVAASERGGAQTRVKLTRGL